MIPIALLLVVFVPMMIEAMRARRNEQLQRARGGIEPAVDVYNVMRVAYPAAFLAMIGEGVARGEPAPAVALAGLVTFVAAKALKWWAIRSLGDAWTFRVVVVPGMTLVRSGPYRFMHHPNYAAVIAELAGVALMSGAIVAGPIAIAGFGALVAKRIAIEDAILR